jgi:hypothetical protein
MVVINPFFFLKFQINTLIVENIFFLFNQEELYQKK